MSRWHNLSPEQKTRKLAQIKSWRDRNADRVREKARLASARWRAKHPRRALDTRLRSEYGISACDYEAMHRRQNGACAICLTDKPLVVDHDHDTGLVRGLLCHGCNVGLGLLGDSASALRRATVYLEKV